MSESKIVKDWLSERNNKTVTTLWNKFWNWVEKNKIFATPEAMITSYEKLRGKEQYKHIDIIKRFILENMNYTIATRRNMFATIKSFYVYNRVQLPTLNTTDRHSMFKPAEIDEQRSLNKKPVQLEDLKKTLINLAEPYRTIILVLFQSGMGFSEFQYFNEHGWQELLKEKDDKKLVDEERPTLIRLYMKKTSTEKIKTFFTFIGKDAKFYIKNWINLREQKIGKLQNNDYLFKVLEKQRRKLIQPTTQMLHNQLFNAQVRAGLIENKRVGRYDLTPHELRDVFKSLCSIAGVSEVASEFFLGHTIDDYGYNKSPEYDVEFFRNEYSKVEPLLNIMSSASIGNFKNIEQQLVEQKSDIESLEKLIAYLIHPTVSQEKLGLSDTEVQEIMIRLIDKHKLEKVALDDILKEEERLRNLSIARARAESKIEVNGNGNKYETTIVKGNNDKELIDLSNQGYEIVKELSDKRILMRRKLVI